MKDDRYPYELLDKIKEYLSEVSDKDSCDYDSKQKEADEEFERLKRRLEEAKK